MDSDSEIITKGKGISAFTHEWTGIELLHEGRYFLVFRAMRMGRWFVLKCVRQDCADDVLHRTLLEKEFDIGFHLQHPNVVRTLGMENVEGLGTCIVLDFIDGMTLRQCIRQNTLTADKCVAIVDELLSALSYLHGRQIVHRDIKPENIMITSNGSHALLIDFGLADSASYAMLKGAAGTHHYAAPECEDGICDSLSDIYSFGKVVEEIALSQKSKRLARLANVCTRKDREARVQSVEGVIRRKARKTVYIKWYFALSVVVLFLAVGSVTFYKFHNNKDIQNSVAAIQKNVPFMDDTMADGSVAAIKKETDSGISNNTDNHNSEISIRKSNGKQTVKKVETDNTKNKNSNKYTLLINKLNQSIQAVYRKHYSALTDTSLTWHSKIMAIQDWGFENDKTVNDIVADFSEGLDAYEQAVIRAKADSVKKSLWKKQEKALPQYVIDHNERIGIYRKYNKGTASGTKWKNIPED